MTWGGVAEVERLGSTRLERWSGAGWTTLRVRTTPHSSIGWVVVGAYTARAELRQVVSVENRDITVAALTYYHDPDEIVLALDDPTVNVRWFGAAGIGLLHDDTAAIQAAINAVGDAGEGAVFVPPTSAFYNVTYAIRVPSNVTIYGVGERSHIKHTGTAAPSGWAGASWFWHYMFYVGSLGPEGETSVNPYSPFSHLTWYGIAAAAAGTIQITFDTNAEADNFTAGDVVFLQSGTTFTDAISGYDDPFMRPLYTQVNIVRSVGDGTVDLVYPLNHDFDASSKIATEAEPYTSYDGTDTYVARNVAMRDLHLEMTYDGDGYAIYVGGAIYCDFRNIIIDHMEDAFGANGLCYSELNNITLNMKGTLAAGLYPLDIACMSQNVLMKNITIDHGGVNIAENGSFITLENFYIGYGHITSGGKHYITLKDGKIARYDNDVSTISGSIQAGNTECEGDIIDNVTIDGVSGAKYCISVLGIGTVVRNCHVISSTDTGGWGIYINSAARDFLVEGNTVGKYGSRNYRDVIIAQTLNTNGIVRNNNTMTTIRRVIDIATVKKTTTGDTTMKTASFVAGQFRYANAVKFTAYGTVAGTNDAKTITLHNSAISGDPAIATISLAAGETGAWKMEVVLTSYGYSATSAVRASVLSIAPDEAVEEHTVYSGTADLTADWAITLVGNLANDGDDIYVNYWAVEPIQDQYTNA